jgi:hypothetical protein
VFTLLKFGKLVLSKIELGMLTEDKLEISKIISEGIFSLYFFVLDFYTLKLVI